MPVRDYNVSASLNTSISGINIAEGMPAANVNNAMRQMMADSKARALELPTLMDIGAAGNGTTNDIAVITSAVSTYGKRTFWGDNRNYLISSNLPAGFRMLDGRITDTRTVQTLGDEWSNIFIGRDAGAATTFIPEQHTSSAGMWASGNHLVFIGGEAGKANTTGRRNVGVGSRALFTNTTGFYVTALGSHAFENNTTGFDSTAVGVQAGQSHTTGSLNNFFGVSAGNKVTSGTRICAFGNSAAGGIATADCTAVGAIGIGFQAGGSLRTGNDMIAIGNLAAQSYQGGDNCICIGGSAGLLLITASNVIAIGSSSLRNSTASQNVGVGTSTGQALTTGTSDVFVGHQAGLSATTADNSVVIGHQAGLALTTGNQNTLIGKSSAGTLSTGSNNTIIGYGANCTAAAQNCTSLGNSAACTGDNQITLGNASIATLRCQVTTITALSDQRDKKEREPLNVGLDFIRGVEIQKWTWAMRGGSARDGELDYGIVSQQLDRLQKKHKAEWLGLVDKTNPKRIEATPGKLLYPAIVALQEMADRLEASEARADALEKRLAKLEAA